MMLEGISKIGFGPQGQGGSKFQPTGILKHFEELKRDSNAEIGFKDIFETAS
jgi:hypothetical protein